MRTNLATTSTQISSRAQVVVLKPRLKMTSRKRAQTRSRLNRTVEREEAKIELELAELERQERLANRTWIPIEEYGNVEDHHEVVSMITGKPATAKKPARKLPESERLAKLEELSFGEGSDPYASSGVSF